jgi:hypothetical protein
MTASSAGSPGLPVSIPRASFSRLAAAWSIASEPPSLTSKAAQRRSCLRRLVAEKLFLGRQA